MRPATTLAIVLLSSSGLAVPASAQSSDAAASAPDATAPAPPPPPAPAAPPGLPPATVPRPPPPVPQATDSAEVPAAPTVDGPGDEEAKADFQDTRRLRDGSPLRISSRYGAAALYGSASLNFLNDSTQGYGLRASNFTLARAGTVQGDDGQTALTPCDSRVGARLGTAEGRSVRGVFLAELGPGEGPDLCHGNRLRHLYVALRSPVLDVLVGRYYGLFGWGGKGFFPNTAAFLGVPGQIYHLEQQIRLSHIFRFDPVDFEIAAASGASVQAGAREAHLGARLAVNHWRGASAQGGGPADASPLQVGVSAVSRDLEVNGFTAVGSTYKLNSSGVSVNAFLPIYPAHGADLSNAFSLTFEWSRTRGLPDMYPGLTGGVLYPALPNPKNVLPPPVYMASLPPGIATFDSQGNVHLLEWQGLLVGFQYHPPIAWGRRAWISANGSLTWSDNALELTPVQGQPFVWAHGRYADVNLFVAPWRGLQLAASFQATRQTLGDGVVTRNARTQLAATYFF
jgi:hypothetical protein